MWHLRLSPWAVLAALLLSDGCQKKTSPPPVLTGTRPRVASLVPAATDLLISMGAADHLVAVSNYDFQRPETKSLPRVGDYQTFDWEQIAALRPDLMIVFITPANLPPGLKQRADELKIQLVNVRTERLADIISETENLGHAVHEEAKSAKLVSYLIGQVMRATEYARGRPRVRTLLVRDKAAQAVVGRDNFLNDILEAAGGENVITTPGWPSIDREMLLSLRPEVIIQLLPEAGPQLIDEAKRIWTTMPQIPAASAGKVYLLKEWYVQNSGSHVGLMAQRFAQILHASPQGDEQ